MKTKCYCIYCPKHPLHEKRKDLDYPAGWEPGHLIWKDTEKEAGVDVECLIPISDAIDDLDIDVDDYEFPITAYGDGCAMTGFLGQGFTLYANCKDEEYNE